MKWDMCLQFGSDVEFAIAEAGRFLSRSAPWRVPTSREKPGGREPHLAAGSESPTSRGPRRKRNF